MQITIDIDDTIAPRVIEAVATNYEYQDEVDDGQGKGIMIPNPEDKTTFMVRIISQILVSNTLAAEGSSIQKAAEVQIKAQVDTSISAIIQDLTGKVGAKKPPIGPKI